MITIITVNYNGLEVTCQLLDSLKEVGFCDEIIVIDNGSSEDQTLPINRLYPKVITIRSEVNLGFAGGNNLGITEAHGDILFFLNNDTTLKENPEKKLEQFFAENPLVGGLSPKICFEYAPDIVQFGGYTKINPLTMSNHTIGYRENQKLHNTPRSTAYLHGAAMAVRKEVIDQVGMMPDCYFLYYEELDWSALIAHAGWKLAYFPWITVYHKESWSTGKGSPTKTYYLTRNRFRFAHRNFSGVQQKLSTLYQLCVSAPINIVKHLLGRRTKHAKAIIRGIKDRNKYDK